MELAIYYIFFTAHHCWPCGKFALPIALARFCKRGHIPGIYGTSA